MIDWDARARELNSCPYDCCDLHPDGLAAALREAHAEGAREEREAIVAEIGARAEARADTSIGYRDLADWVSTRGKPPSGGKP